MIFCDNQYISSSIFFGSTEHHRAPLSSTIALAPSISFELADLFLQLLNFLVQLIVLALLVLVQALRLLVILRHLLQLLLKVFVFGGHVVNKLLVVLGGLV